MSDQIDINQFSNALQQKVDLPSGKSQADIDYVVEWKMPTSSDKTWYRLYKSGWVEQGGIINQYHVIFPKEFANTLYTVSALPIVHSGDGGANDMQYLNKTTTGIDFRIRWGGSYAPADSDERCWEAKGFAAQS